MEKHLYMKLAQERNDLEERKYPNKEEEESSNDSSQMVDANHNGNFFRIYIYIYIFYSGEECKSREDEKREKMGKTEEGKEKVHRVRKIKSNRGQFFGDNV